jgi:hypothetical protein
MRIEVVKSGDFFTNRFQGRFKTSQKLLESDLKAGCYNDGYGAEVSSVTIRVEPGAPAARLDLLYGILERNGWPKARIKVVPPSQ